MGNIVQLTPEHISFLNEHLKTLSAYNIIKWAYFTFPNLYQTTAFGLTGLVTVDIISKLSQELEKDHLIDLIFLDTLYHFPQTHELVQKVEQKYRPKLHVYK